MTAQDFIARLKHLLERRTEYNNSLPFNCGYVYWSGVISFDCIGMVKSVINNPDVVYKTTPMDFPNPSQPYVVPGTVIPDTTEIGILNLCKDVRWGDFSNMTPGEYLYTEGHGGIYIGECGDVNVIECTTAWGANGVCASYVDQWGNRFSHKGGSQSVGWQAHGKLPYLTQADGWECENGTWYYYKNGVRQTGWLKDGGLWYLLNGEGAMLTGWQMVKNKWYYLQPKKDDIHPTGSMRVGWIYSNSNWYYLQEKTDSKHEQGEMRTYWVYDKKYKGWFYFDTNGVMQTGWKCLDKFWYMFQTKTDEEYVLGMMRTGWYEENGKWYYLDPETGKMYTGVHEIDHKTYTFGADGALIE